MHRRPHVRIVILSLFILCVGWLHGCASLTSRFESPTVKISSLELLETDRFSQKFRIGLLITNPNPDALPVAGMAYTLSLNGFSLVNGASNQVPSLAAYSETPVTIEASTDLFAALRFINSLANNPRDNLQYEFDAKIDFEGWRPTVNVKRDGTVSLEQAL